MVLRCRYCNEVMKKVYEDEPTSSADPYVCIHVCPSCKTRCDFNESCGQVETWIKKNGDIEIVDFDFGQ